MRSALGCADFEKAAANAPSGKGKAMDTAHDRDELCHFLENERKGKQIE